MCKENLFKMLLPIFFFFKFLTYHALLEVKGGNTVSKMTFLTN